MYQNQQYPSYMGESIDYQNQQVKTEKFVIKSK